jgi:glycosyltransferase involved in cell wall biosynthesis
LILKKKYEIENYVLCTGNICARKNQYNLALACINLNLNLVLVGNVLDGETLYGEKLAAFAKQHSNIRWIKELAHGSDELIAAYFNCMIYALPSKSETQPISALEAVAVNKPLVLLDRMYAHQSFYKGATLSKFPSVKSVEKALSTAMGNSISSKQNIEILNCSKEKVGSLYKNLYENL